MGEVNISLRTLSQAVIYLVKGANAVKIRGYLAAKCQQNSNCVLCCRIDRLQMICFDIYYSRWTFYIPIPVASIICSFCPILLSKATYPTGMPPEVVICIQATQPAGRCTLLSDWHLIVSVSLHEGYFNDILTKQIKGFVFVTPRLILKQHMVEIAYIVSLRKGSHMEKDVHFHFHDVKSVQVLLMCSDIQKCLIFLISEMSSQHHQVHFPCYDCHFIILSLF